MAARLVFRIHAVQRMSERGISDREVREILSLGEIIEAYADDRSYASRLVPGWCRGRPLHVVAAENIEEHETVVVTPYDPDPTLWEPGFRQTLRPWNA